MSSIRFNIVVFIALLLGCILYQNYLKLKSLELQVHSIRNNINPHVNNSNQVIIKDGAASVITAKKEKDSSGVSSGVSSSSRFLVVNKAAGDGKTDDTIAIQRAINKAANNKRGAVVVLKRGTFKITQPLLLKGGVTLQGKGYGSSPLAIQFDAGGTVIAYCGEDYAIKVVGHSSKIENLAVYDWQYPAGSYCENVKAAGGIKVEADGRGVESVTMRNLLIYWFMGGTALTLEAKNNGGIAYASFENIRVRHAKVGIHLTAEANSFVNSNTFHDGAISGGITDVGILASGPGACNDNQFKSMVIEPPSTEIAHVHVSGAKTNVILDKVRLEGTDMPHNKPLIIVEDDSYGNIMNGLLGHTFVQADMNRNPGIQFASNKMTGVNPSFNNLFWNSAFHGMDELAQEIPGWTFNGNDFSFQKILESEEEALYPAHHIISIERTASSTLKLSPSRLSSSAAHSFCTFGVYAKTSEENSIVAAMKSRSGSIISSSPHTGSGKWEFIGMSSLFDQTNGPLPYFSITGNVTITAPTFSYGHGSANPASEFLSSSGARMSGVLSMNLIEVSPPSSAFWTLPRDGNIFDIKQLPESGTSPCSTSYQYVTRINHSTADRFEKGSVITLLFPPCGICVPCLGLTNGAYLKLLGGTGFAPSPSAAHSSITLVSGGSGTWAEISRNTL